MTGGYFPLWRKIFDSSINEESLVTRWVWVWMLSNANIDGILTATLGAISRGANIPMSETVEALEALQSPDPNSTTPDEDGRRVVSGGQNTWVLVNYEHYRAMAKKEQERASTRDRVARHREKKKGVTDESLQSVTVTDGNEEYEKVTVPLRDRVRDRDSDRVSESPKKREKKKKRSVFKKPLLAEVVSYLDEKGETRIDPSSFLDFYESKGWMVGKNPMKDWKAAIRQWIRARDEGHVKQGGVDMHVGATPKAELDTVDKERKVLVQHIMKHAMHLLKIGGLNDTQMIIVASTSEALEAVAESGMEKGLMEQKFYTIHDGMMGELFNTLSETEDAELQADFPGGGINFDVWVRKCLQEQFKINDPLEYDLEGA